MKTTTCALVIFLGSAACAQSPQGPQATSATVQSSAVANPAPELPLFKLTCKDGFRPHPHLGRVVYTQDPGYALTTGRCIDIGKITIQQMRALAARPPYFSNGSAKSIRDIVDFYDRRYRIGYTEQEKQDLVNLMSVL